MGEGAVIGIVDQGVKWNHPDLIDNIWINQPEIDAGMSIDWVNGSFTGANGVDDNTGTTSNNNMPDDAIGWSFVNGQTGNNSNQTYGENSHGTHVAGCAAAVTNNGIGVSGSAGPASNIKILGTRHASISTPSGGIQNGYDGVLYCADMGADVINCSWGGPGSGYYPNQYVDYATAQGALVVTAAGNGSDAGSGIQHGEPFEGYVNGQYINTSNYQDFPSDCDAALCVAATTQNDSKASFSDYGDPIDVASPGVAILSTVVANNGYASFQGTSMASPIVAGVAAAVKSLSPELSPSEIRERIMNTADYIDDVNDKLPNLLVSDFTYTEAITEDNVPNPGEVIDLDLFLENDIFFWTDAEGITVSLSTEMEGVTIINDAISFPDMASGIALWGENPLSFETVETLSELTIPLKLVIEANENWDYPLHKEVNLEVELSLAQEGWPFATGGLTNSSPLIIDIDNEGQKEIVFGDQVGNIHVMNSDGTIYPNFPVALGAQNASALAVSDINNNGTKEIIGASNSGLIKAFAADGSLVFEYNLGGMIKSNPIIADVDGNGSKEIIVANLTGDIVVLDATGNPLFDSPVSIAPGFLSSAAVADLNGDGILEFIGSQTTGNLVAISLNNFQSIAGFPVELGASSWNGPIVANIDSDPEFEVLCGTIQGNVAAVNHDGSVIFNNNYGVVRTSITVFNLDDSGSPEIIFGNNDGDLYVLDSAGNTVGGFPVNVGATIESTPALVDFDVDGTIEMLFGDNNGHLHAINLNGEESANFPIEVLGTTSVAPCVMDSDNDGDVEIAIPNSAGMNLIDFKRESVTYWAYFKANPERTGCVDNITPNSDNDIDQLFNTKLISNYPNPFNPTTSIKFAVENSSNIEISVYNILGQKVKTLVNTQFNKGNHNVIWHGTDENGENVSSGVYFYRMNQDGKNIDTKKCILLK